MEASGGKMKLYSYYMSSCSWRVRIALEYKELPYEIIPFKGEDEEFIKEYKKINPMGQVPALIVGDKHVLVQSVAILEYLDEVYPEKPLLPKDPLTRAKVREISELIASGIQPLQNLRVLYDYSDIESERLKLAQLWIRRGLTALEEILSHSAGKFCVGDDMSMADCCLIPQIGNAHRFKVDISGFPTISRLDGSLPSLPAFEKAQPSKQPDYPQQES